VTPDHDGDPDHLDRQQIEARGGAPDELLRHGIEPVTGHDGRECWPRWQVEEWLAREQ
jgi:hypothetical protein